MTGDPFDAAKRDLEERDRTDMLVEDARLFLNRVDDDWTQWPQEVAIQFLMSAGSFSWGDAKRSLEIIEHEDSEAE